MDCRHPVSYGSCMQAVATRRRTQPPPTWVVFEDLANPGRATGRSWLYLLDDETPPHVLAAQRPTLVVWSSIWTKRPDANIQFDLAGSGSETALRWTLLVEPPAPDDRLFRHMCQRIGELINAGLRYTYGH